MTYALAFRAAERLGHGLVPEPLDRLHRALVAAVARDERLDDGELSVRGERQLGGAEGRVRSHPDTQLLQPLG